MRTILTFPSGPGYFLAAGPWWSVRLAVAGRQVRSDPIHRVQTGDDRMNAVTTNFEVPPVKAMLTDRWPVAGQESLLQVTFHSMESLANGLTNITAFGLYSFAGLLLLPAVFATSAYPRWLAWLGTVEWGIAALATTLLVFVPNLATGPLLVSFALYAPWVWGSAVWLLRRNKRVIAVRHEE